MKFKFLALTIALFISLLANSQENNMINKFKTDKFLTDAGNEVKFTFFGHASFMIYAGGTYIYVDPIGKYIGDIKLPSADVILITHQHGDHFDPVVVEGLRKSTTKIYTTPTVSAELNSCEVMKNGDEAECIVKSDNKNVNIKIEALAAYNTTDGRKNFHPQGRDNGYIVNICGARIYISGDSEPTYEMKSQKNIDVLFLSVNQPYTMTEEQAADVVKAIKPKLFYPIHYGEVEEKTDLEKLKKLVSGYTDIRIMPME